MSDVLFFNLPIKSQFERFLEDEVEYNPSLGLLSIASFLQVFGHRAHIVDYNFERYSIDHALQRIEEVRPVLIGMTVFTENYQAVLRFAKQIKKFYRDVKIVVGGPHATLQPGDLIKSSAIDFVSRKEGESMFLELLEHLESNGEALPLDMIDGLTYRDGREIHQNKNRTPLKNLDLLPLINREMMEPERYKETINITTSRGCPANCIYCAATAIAGATYRMRDISSVFLEMVWLKDLFGDRLEKVYFVDDTFTAEPRRVEEFIGKMNEYALPVKWACESRVDVMTEALLEKMYNAGCYSVQFGIESGNQRVLDTLRKKIDLRHARKIMTAAARFDMEICLSFMFGHYCDTIATMEETLRFIEQAMEENPSVKIGIGYNTPLPGTWQYTHAEKIGMKILTDDFSRYDLMTPIIETEQFKTQDLVQVYNRAAKYLRI